MELPEILGESEAILDLLGEVSRVAGLDRPVVVTGERGTGKELVASRLHFLSGRWEEPFVAMNCGAFTESLVETELFGYEAGAFTGAAKRRPGRFEVADGGTLFLDEIGLLPMNVQEKLLRVLEYGVFYRVGGMEEVRVNVRIIGATHADLMGLVSSGGFKPDLLDRMAFEVLEVPPLRERAQDIELLAGHYLRRMAFEIGVSPVPELDDACLKILYHHSWPGNVRELKNVIERAVARGGKNLSVGMVLNPFERRWGAAEMGPASGRRGMSRKIESADAHIPQGESGGFTARVSEFEVGLIAESLDTHGGNRTLAAKHLGLTYHQFRALARKYQDHQKLRKYRAPESHTSTS